ncbi:hypothetical protein PgNI_11304 [Pyricularia grisea]|uniref:Uncharacterized protein n=1 Tax=Pyricularia grisea TaxID=148305 RepID=A0A6P8APW5_PYRGI|nr:hypothetical protein PgNI_11304 [Pyricularia grisea]TLD04063.1 hypothetical protein PgNI_11304 [Pyricularia grisea]
MVLYFESRSSRYDSRMYTLAANHAVCEPWEDRENAAKDPPVIATCIELVDADADQRNHNEKYGFAFQALLMMILPNIRILQMGCWEKPEGLEFIERDIKKRMQQGPQESAQGAMGTAFHLPLSYLHELRIRPLYQSPQKLWRRRYRLEEEWLANPSEGSADKGERRKGLPRNKGFVPARSFGPP